MSDKRRFHPLPEYNKSIPEWAINKAISIVDAEWLSKQKYHREFFPPWSTHVIEPLAEMIAKYEEPPVDKYEVILNEVLKVLNSSKTSLEGRRIIYTRWSESIAKLKGLVENESQLDFR